MNELFLNELQQNGIDVKGTLERLAGDTDLYMTIMSSFPDDTTMSELETALQSKNLENAFTAAHALKGISGNLGFMPLFQSLSELVILIRAGKVSELDNTFAQAKQYYDDTIRIIRKYCNLSSEKNK